MSLGLKARLKKPIEVRDLILDTSQALQELLNISVVPSIKAEEFGNGEWRSLGLGFHELSLGSPLLGLSIENEPETVSVSVYERTVDRFSDVDWEPEELGTIASIEICGARTGLGLALVAAVALAIARRSNSLIADEARLYSATIDSSAEEFLGSTRIAERFSNYREAANCFENKSYGSNQRTNR
jgi:hypothetical protein